MDIILWLKILLSFITSFFIAYVSIPTIVRVAKMTQWLDKPNKRKIHKQPIPRLAGAAIFASISVTTLLFLDCQGFRVLNSFFIALIILFFIGIKDDILVTAPLTKLLGQTVAVSLVVILGNIRITNLHGFFHIFHIPEFISIPLTILTLLVILNSFNFIDGIDGLAATIAIEVAATFAIWFYKYREYQYTILATILIGSLLAYLPYNLSSGKNKIFFGDTGTLIIGLVLGILAIEFNQTALRFIELRYFPAPAVSFGIMILPFYDMLRIIYIRTITGRKFYVADTNHIHHILLKLGFSQRQTLIILASVNLLFIILSFWLAKYLTLRRLLLVQLILIGIIFYIPSHILRIKEDKNER